MAKDYFADVVVVKRDGREVPFDVKRIENAVYKATEQTMPSDTASELVEQVAHDVAKKAAAHIKRDGIKKIDVESIQDLVEKLLMTSNYRDVAKSYILYRDKRNTVRSIDSKVMENLSTIITNSDHDIATENGNIDSDCPMATLLKISSETSKEFYLNRVLNPAHARAHREGLIHIHDLDLYGLTMTCCQIDLAPLFENGFNTGHGHIRTPNSIKTACNLACIVIQSNQNDQHGGQSIPFLDHNLAPYVGKSFIKHLKNICEITEDELPSNVYLPAIENLSSLVKTSIVPEHKFDEKAGAIIDACAFTNFGVQEPLMRKNIEKALEWTEKETYQGMEALHHNLNTMHSRAGAQVPFSSINYGTDTSTEGRMVIKQCLLALEAGLGLGETSIFPIHIMKMMDGINKKPGDPNYDLYELACRVSAKRLFPNFMNEDTSFNKPYIKYDEDGKLLHDTVASTMGCRTRVMGNSYDPSRETVAGRGNLSFTTINLPRLALLAKGDKDKFRSSLAETMDLVHDQLLERFEVQGRRKARNFPFLMGNAVWKDSGNLGPDDEVREVIKHGTLTVGFCGLAEAMVALFGKHHAEDSSVYDFAYDTIKYMHDKCVDWSKEEHLNYSVIATPAESTAGRFIRCDKKTFGILPGVTEREYYTNSFHVPVYYELGWKRKIDLEAPFHKLCLAGAITYVELDGNPSDNVEGFKALVDYMMSTDAGYCSINFQVDFDPVCGYTGIIGDVCPRCGRKEWEGVSFETVQELRKKHGCSC